MAFILILLGFAIILIIWFVTLVKTLIQKKRRVLDKGSVLYKMVDHLFFLLGGLIVLIIIAWVLGGYGNSRVMMFHPNTIYEGQGLVLGLALGYLGYSFIFLFWSLMLRVVKEDASPFYLKMQMTIIFILGVLPSIFVLAISVRSVRDAFRKIQPSPEYYDEHPPVTDGTFVQPWYPGDTTVRSIANYRNGKRHGRQVFFYYQGDRMEEEAYYQNGRLDSLFTYHDLEGNPRWEGFCWDKDGKIREKQENRLKEDRDSIWFQQIRYFYSHQMLDSACYFDAGTGKWVRDDNLTYYGSRGWEYHFLK